MSKFRLKCSVGLRPVARILLSDSSIPEDAAIDDIVGTLSVVNATGTPSFTLDDDAGGLFALDGADVVVAAALDFETEPAPQITVSVTGVTPTITATSIIITVTDVSEVPAGLTAVIDGTGEKGLPLWCTPANNNGTVTFQWRRNGTNITDETNQNYYVQDADLGASITCMPTDDDGDGTASNAIVGTWVHVLQDGTYAIASIDHENRRYYSDGNEYDETAFEALAWVPNTLTADLWSADQWGLPTGFSATHGVIMVDAEMTDTGVDNHQVNLSDGTANESMALFVRWSQASATSRFTVTDGGVAQAIPNSNAAGAWTANVRAQLAVKYKLNDVWQIDRNGILIRDAAATLPTVDQMHIGSNHAGASVAGGTGYRVDIFAADAPASDIQIIRGQDVLDLKSGADGRFNENDGIDARDIFGDGFPAILYCSTDGRAGIYRQTERNVFGPEIVIYAAADRVECENIRFLDYEGTGNFIAIQADQDPGTLYAIIPDTPGDYEGTWTATQIATGHQFVQALQPLTLSGDDRETMFYAFEDNANGTGGINKIRWNGTTWVNTVVKQHDGAYGICPELFANGDFLFTARTASNPGAERGIFRLTQGGTESTITNAAGDWKWAFFGDFFGNGNRDIVACKGGVSAATEFYLLDSANAWAVTAIDVGRVLQFNAVNAGFYVNGREAVVIAGDSYCEIWAWNGSAWTLYKTLIDQGTAAGTLKHDGKPARANIFRGSGNDIVWGDSFSNRIIAYRMENVGPPWDFTYLKNNSTTYGAPADTGSPYSRAKPDYQETYYDELFDPDHRCPITRITGVNGATSVGTGKWGLVNRTGYPTRCAWNCHQTKIFLEEISGGLAVGNRLVISAIAPYSPLYVPTGTPGGAEVRWHPTDPDLMIYASAAIFGDWDPESGTKRTIRDFTAEGYTSLAFNGKGKLSYDGTTILLTGTKAGVEQCFVYDWVNNIKYDDLIVPTASPMSRVTCSASGLRIIMGHDDENDRVYSRTGANNRAATHTFPPDSLSHYDTNLDAAGNDLIVGRARLAPYDTGEIYKANLDAGGSTITKIQTTGRPGYQNHTTWQDLTRAWVATAFEQGTGEVYDDELVLMRPDGSENRRVCHLHSEAPYQYDNEMQPNQSLDGGQIIWHCRWEAPGNAVTECDSYLIDLRNLV